MDDLTFGQRLIFYRTKAKMLQKELAEKVGITPTALNYYEKDKREPNVLIISRLAKVLNVTGDELLGLDTQSTKTEQYSAHEKNLITAYRKNPKMQEAVDRLLGIEDDETELVFIAAESEENIEPGYTRVSKDFMQRLREAPETKEI